MALDLGTLRAHITADDREFTVAVDRSEGRFRSFAGAVGTGVARTGAAFLGIAGSAGVLGIKTAASAEQAKIGFTTMLKSGEAADAFLRDLGKFAAETPFELPGLQTAAASLISAGVNANSVIPIMRSLGNATSGMGTGAEGVKRATVALQQMNAAGKISMEDLNQLRDAGIPVYDLLAAATGKSVKQVAELANTGKLGQKELGQLMKALESGKGLERFNGMMDAQSRSLVGLWSTVKDTVSTGLATAVAPLIPLLKSGLGSAIEYAAAAAPRLAAGVATATAAVTKFVAGLRLDPTAAGAPFDSIRAKGEAVRHVIDRVVAAVRGFFASRGDGGAGISVNFAAIMESARALSPVLEDGRRIYESIVDVLPDLDTITGAVANTMRFLADNADKLAVILPVLAVAFGLYKLAAAAGNVVALASLPLDAARVASNFALAAAIKAQTAATEENAVATAVASNTVTVSAAKQGAAWLASKVAMVASTVASWAMTAAQWAMNAAMSANPIMIVVLLLAALAAGLKWLWDNNEGFREAMTSAWEGLRNVVGRVVSWLTAAVPAAIEWVKNAFLHYTPLGLVISHWGQIQAFIAGAVDKVKATIAWFAALPAQMGAWLSSVKDAAVEKFTQLVDWVRQLPGRIVEAIGNLHGMLVDKGADVVRGLISGISGMAGQLADFVRTFIVEHIPGPIREALGINSPSKVAADLTRWVPLGAVEGLKETAPQLDREVRRVFDLTGPARITLPAYAAPAPQQQQPALVGVMITGTLSSPWGPVQVAGQIQQAIATARTDDARFRRLEKLGGS